jgi:HK97 family phage prohead protease
MDKGQIKAHIEKSENKYTIVASTNGVDRDNEIIRPEAWKSSLKSYLDKNPVILWAHDYSKPPIAKATGGKITESGMNLDIEFADTDFARDVRGLYDGGFMNSFSVGFIPNDGVAGKNGVFEYTDVELLEVSAVPVPANPGANMIRAAQKSGIIFSDETKKVFKIEDKPEENDGVESAAEPEVKRSKAVKLSKLYARKKR